MARGRMIDKRISKSKKFRDLKYDRSRVLYFMVYPHLDCEGRYSGDPEDIKEDCCPKLKYSIRQIAESVIDMAEVGLLILYEIKNKVYVQFTKFEEFQSLKKDREAPSKIPAPESVGVTQENSGPTPSLYLRLSLRLNKGKKVKELIFFDYKNGDWKNISQNDIDGWKQAYPACDIFIELFQMREWCLSNPNKTKKNWRRFITNWLSRTQEKGGTKGLKKTKYEGIKDWYEEKIKEGMTNEP